LLSVSNFVISGLIFSFGEKSLVYVFGFRGDLKPLVEDHLNQAFLLDFARLLISFVYFLILSK